MKYRQLETGFTAVELLVALIIGMLLLGSAYQLYTSVTTTSGDATRRSQASNVAYALLRENQNNTALVTNPCAVRSSTPTVPSYADLPGATATISVTCPYSDITSISLLTITITFNNADQTEQITRAITAKAS